MSTEKPILAVIGATGIQGGSVVSYFLSLDASPYKIRGLTRNVQSTASQALVSKGVEMVEADLSDAKSLERAFSGAAAIFGVTDFWHPFFVPENRAKAEAAGITINEWCYEDEKQKGKNVFDAAAKTTGLQRLVFSSLPDTRKLSNGKYTHIWHFDSKAHAAEYGKTTYPELAKKTSNIFVGVYLSNFLPSAITPPFKDADGTIVFSTGLEGPEWPFVAAEEDVGPFVYALLQTKPGQKLTAHRQLASMDDFTNALSKHLGQNVEYRPQPIQELPLPPELHQEFIEQFGYAEEFGYDGNKVDPSLVYPKDLGVQLNLGTIEDWIKKQDWSALTSAA